MWWITAKVVPWLLSDKQKQQQFLAAITWLWSPTAPTQVTWPHAVSSCF
jgi:hypothetical protein